MQSYRTSNELSDGITAAAVDSKTQIHRRFRAGMCINKTMPCDLGSTGKCPAHVLVQLPAGR